MNTVLLGTHLCQATHIPLSDQCDEFPFSLVVINYGEFPFKQIPSISMYEDRRGGLVWNLKLSACMAMANDVLK